MPFAISFPVLLLPSRPNGYMLYGSWITERVKKIDLKGKYAFSCFQRGGGVDWLVLCSCVTPPVAVHCKRKCFSCLSPNSEYL